MLRTAIEFFCRGLVWLLFIVFLLPITACEDEEAAGEKAYCGNWVYHLTKVFDGEELIACNGRFTPTCHLDDGSPVNDSNLGTELVWDFSVDGDFTILSVEWSMFGTNSTLVFEADVIDGKCGEGTIFFVVDDGDDLDGCAAIEITEIYWESAGEIQG